MSIWPCLRKMGKGRSHRMPRVCQVFCVNDLAFVLGFVVGFGFGFAVVVGFGDGVQGKGAFPLPLHIHVEGNLRLHYANLPGLVMRSGHRTVK